jgi:hypothetical protein
MVTLLRSWILLSSHSLSAFEGNHRALDVDRRDTTFDQGFEVTTFGAQITDNRRPTFEQIGHVTNWAPVTQRSTRWRGCSGWRGRGFGALRATGWWRHRAWRRRWRGCGCLGAAEAPHRH